MNQRSPVEGSDLRHILRFRGLTARRHLVGSAQLSGDAPAEGDIVRFEFSEDGLWFYCRVERLIDRDALLCQVVETQSWAELGTIGILPGRDYVAPADCVLSIVRQQAAASPRAGVVTA